MKPQDRTRAILLSKAGTSAKMVLIAIADRMADTRLWAWCGPGDIQERTSLGERQTRTILGELLADGILTRETRDTDHGRHEGYVIEWTRLAAVEPAKTARGGKREPAKTAGDSAKIAGIGAERGGKDCHDDRQTLPELAAKTAETGGKDCNRSGTEAITQAAREADQGEREGASLTTATDPDATASAPPAEPTSATEASDAPTTDPTPEHVNETNDGDRVVGGDFPRVVSGAPLGLFDSLSAPAPAPTPEPTPRPGPAPKAPTPPKPPPVAEAAPIASEKPKRARKERPPPDELAEAAAEAKREEQAFKVSVTDQFGEAYREVFGRRYDWCFKGRENDGTRRDVWIDSCRITKSAPAAGLAQLRRAAFAYCLAVKAGQAFPYGEPATTFWFTKNLAAWKQRGDGVPVGNGRPVARKGMLATEAFADEDDAPPIPERIVIDASWSH